LKPNCKEKAVITYKGKKGGITNEQFVSLEDIQKANNEYQHLIWKRE
jgi:hypothetical protein